MKHFAFILLLFNLFFFPLQGQVNDIVHTDGEPTPLHNANTGTITFMSGNISLEKIKDSDLLTTFEFNPESDLSIRVIMNNPITNYLHVLAPALRPDELTKNGIYQFSFFVDSNFIYKENLNPGAGLNKNTATAFRVPLISTTGEDSWGTYLWDRFMLKGGGNALTEGTHVLKIEIRPYLNIDGVIVGDLIAQGQVRFIIKLKAVPARQIAIQPIIPGSGWLTSNEHYNKQKIEELNKNIARNSIKEITSIVVIKDGKLLIEEYFNNENRKTLHDTRSVGKSFTSALLGIAIKEGYIKNVNQSLNSFYNLKKFANYSSKKDSVTIKDLLTMSSAFNGSDDQSESPGNEENMYPTNDWVKFALDLPMDSTKYNGKQWDYFTAGAILLGDILNKSVPDGLDKYSEKKLFQPLKIKKYQWQYTPQKVVNTAGGLQMSSLDYAKFGQLYRNEGLWDGKEILPARWVNETLTKHLQIPDRADEFYGYLFWNKTYTINGKKYETFYCAGNGGSKIFIFKDLPVVVVVTAKAYGRPYAHPQVDRMMKEFILPALLE